MRDQDTLERKDIMKGWCSILDQCVILTYSSMACHRTRLLSQLILESISICPIKV